MFRALRFIRKSLSVALIGMGIIVAGIETLPTMIIGVALIATGIAFYGIL